MTDAMVFEATLSVADDGTWVASVKNYTVEVRVARIHEIDDALREALVAIVGEEARTSEIRIVSVYDEEGP